VIQLLVCLRFCYFSCQALGCLLYRILYLKSAFDGESKLQVLNGNYRIPESPKYNPSVINLIKDMLASSPDARPDITQASPLTAQRIIFSILRPKYYSFLIVSCTHWCSQLVLLVLG
jgi:serine/threonine protein kinase